MGFGVFMGIVPVWGFQLAIAITLSFLFRLNKALVILAANISIPPMIPLVLFLSHRVGSLWMGSEAKTISFTDELTLEWIHANFVQYVYGAVTLAIGAGLFFGLLTYALLKLAKQKRNRAQG